MILIYNTTRTDFRDGEYMTAKFVVLLRAAWVDALAYRAQLFIWVTICGLFRGRPLHSPAHRRLDYLGYGA